MVQRQTFGQPRSFGRTFPGGWDSAPSLLSSIFDSADRSGNRPILWMLESLSQLAPVMFSPIVPPSNQLPGSGLVNEERIDKGKGKALAMDLDGADQPNPEPAPTEDDGFVASLQEAMAASRRTSSRVPSPDEPGPSGSSPSDGPPPSGSALLSRTHPSGSDTEQAEIDHAILMSSIEHIENTFHTLRANFTFPTQLDCHLSDPSSGSTDEDTNRYIAVYLPTTAANLTVLHFVRDLRALLHRLDDFDSDNDIEAKSLKEMVAGSINRVLENVENQAEEAIGKWMSLQTTGVDLMGQ